jgi:ribonucleoside-diphosphate reductase subunit M1
MYYLRSRPAADPIKFTVDVEALLKDGGKIDVGTQSKLVKRSSELNEKENLDLTDKKLKTNNNVEIKTRKLKTIPIE